MAHSPDFPNREWAGKSSERLAFRWRPYYLFRRRRWFLRFLSLTLLINFSAVFVFPPGLLARPVPHFREFREDRSELKTYLDRATNMQDLDQWRSYVQAGLISMKADWEEDAIRAMQKERDRIREHDLDEDEEQEALNELQTEYETSRVDWETEASQVILEKEAGFRLKQERVQGLEISQ
ncbi:MAG: hypothetical protein KDK25_11960, partial [Leptospiraceae bacterium]|nr:hypothetical protein [Leptospiraceae bacterium]